MNPFRALSLLLFTAAAVAGVAIAACDSETATTAVVENGYPAPPDGGDPAKQTVVYRTWWVATYFPDPVPGGMASSELRIIPGSDFAYAVLAPGWDPASTTPPTSFVVVKSKSPLTVGRSEVLHVAISDQTFAGNCAAKQPLSQSEADFITQSIFPGEFMNATYDAKTCVTTPVPMDGGDEGGEGGDEAGVEAGREAGPDADAGSDAAKDAEADAPG